MKFEAGTYYVGDPCYVYGQGWDDILVQTDFFQNIPEDLDGKIWAANTAYGDGRYEDDNMRRYSVDAGLIGIVHQNLMENGFPKGHGYMITFDRPFECYEDSGVIHIGNIVIDTDPSDDNCNWCGENYYDCRCDAKEDED